MAVGEIRKTIEGLYASIQNKAERSKTDKRFAHIYKINASTFARALEKALKNHPVIQEMVDDGMISARNIVNYQDVYEATKYVITNRKTLIGGLRHRSVTDYQEGDDLWIHRTSDKEHAQPEYVNKINASFKREVFDRWKEKAEMGDVLTADKLEGQVGLGMSHQQRTNQANASLLNHLESLEITVDGITESVTEDVMEKIFALLEIDWKLEQDPVTGKMEWIIKGELAGHNPGYIAGKDLGPEWEQYILDKFQEVIDGKAGDNFRDPYFKASNPFINQLTDNQINKIHDYYKNVAKARTINRPKKHKKTKRSGDVKNKVKAPKNKKKNLRGRVGKIAPSRTREKGLGKQASTDAATQLAIIKAQINKRLPQEVARNMGRPALRMQTGTFAGSAQVLTLHQAQRSIVAKYTYLLNPYQTFENEGKRRWPLAYNPKPLIAKSIRNLARGRINQKLTLRRV